VQWIRSRLMRQIDRVIVFSVDERSGIRKPVP
jgi:hypothetical protein